MPDLADSGGLVLDTSVWLNLLATDAMEAILMAWLFLAMRRSRWSWRSGAIPRAA